MMPLKTDGNLSAAARALYTRVAFYYYKCGLTQEEIAQILQMSRQRVSRILNECLDIGIVEIRIHGDESNYLELENKIAKTYGLEAVRVVGGVTPENVYSELGLHAGQYLAEVVRDGSVIGFSRGQALSATVSQTPALNLKNLVAVQLMGGWNNPQSGAREDDIVHRFGERTSANTIMLHAPVLLKDKGLKRTIIQEPFFLEAYKIIQSCDIAVLGVGRAGVSSGSYFGEEISLPKNAIGEVCTHLFDIHGNSVKSGLEDRIISVELEDLMKIPLRIGIAGTASKLTAILGAVRGKYINALITDAETAAFL